MPQRRGIQVDCSPLILQIESNLRNTNNMFLAPWRMLTVHPKIPHKQQETLSLLFIPSDLKFDLFLINNPKIHFWFVLVMLWEAEGDFRKDLATSGAMTLIAFVKFLLCCLMQVQCRGNANKSVFIVTVFVFPIGEGLELLVRNKEFTSPLVLNEE